MQRLFSYMRIQLQVAMIAVLAVIGIAALGAISHFGNIYESRYRQTASLGNDIAVNAAKFQTRLMQMRQDEKDFLLRNDQIFALQVTEHAVVSQQLLDQLDAEAKAAGFAELAESLGRVTKALAAYSGQFETLTESRKRLGMTPDEGFRGVLRQSARMLERWIDETGDEALMVTFLTMRRYEWEFMLRGDQKISGQFRQECRQDL